MLALARDEVPDLLKGSTIGAVDLRQSRYGSRRNALLMLAVVVFALALLATANLANLTFADLASRIGDFALRSALGGSTRAIVMSEMMPCAALAVAGSALGLWAAATAAPWMLSLDPSLAAAGITMTVDWRVALAGLFAALTVMAAAVAIPGWRIARRGQLAFGGGPRLTDARGGRIRSWLVGAQTAMALVLLSAAALVVTTLQRTAAIDPGFDPSHVVTGQLRLADNAFPDHSSRVRFIRAVLERLRETPGIVGAGTTLNLFTVGASFTTNVSVEDAPRPDGQAYTIQFRRVSPGYFEAMRIRVLRGRAFQPTDGETSPLVAVVSESFARRYWPNSDAIGRRIKRGAATSPWAEIVGVVADVRDAGLNQSTGPVMYTFVLSGQYDRDTGRARGANGGRSALGDSADQAGGVGHRSRAAAIEHRRARGLLECLAWPAAVSRVAGGALQRVRTPVGDHRCVRRDFSIGVRTHERGRHSHCARRTSVQRAAASGDRKPACRAGRGGGRGPALVRGRFGHRAIAAGAWRRRLDVPARRRRRDDRRWGSGRDHRGETCGVDRSRSSAAR